MIASSLDVHHELFECLVELTTPTLRTVEEIGVALAAARARLGADCDRQGLRLFAAGTHPLPLEIAIRVTDTPYYQAVASRLGPALPEQLVCGLHVHFGLPSLDVTRNALEGVIPWLPSVLAATVNSPYVEGAESPFRSVRARRLGRLGSGPLPSVRDSTADADGKESGWWDARVNQRYGTLEIRVADQPTELWRSVALVALLQALVVAAARQANPAADRVAYLVTRDQALAGSLSTAPLARHVEPIAKALGTWNAIAALLDAEREADRQLRIGRSRGLDAVVADVVTRTMCPTPALG